MNDRYGGLNDLHNIYLSIFLLFLLNLFLCFLRFLQTHSNNFFQKLSLELSLVFSYSEIIELMIMLAFMFFFLWFFSNFLLVLLLLDVGLIFLHQISYTEPIIEECGDLFEYLFGTIITMIPK